MTRLRARVPGRLSLLNDGLFRQKDESGTHQSLTVGLPDF